MIFLLGCIASHQTLRTSTSTQRVPVQIKDKKLTLRYEQAQTREPKKDEIKRLSKTNKQSNDIWTLSPYPRPNITQKPRLYTLDTDIHTDYTYDSDQITKLEMSLPEQSKEKVSGHQASISGPSERISSDLIILRTQLAHNSRGNTVSWTSSISPAPCPVQIQDFVCTPPKHTIEHTQSHNSPVDSFSYTQLTLEVSPIPIPVYLTSTLQNTKKETIHRTFIHPASIYVGISAPYWTQINHPLSIRTKIVETNGSPGQEQDISIHLIGSSTIQHCNKTPCSLKPNRTGWHQIIATATDIRGNKTQSVSSVFVYGKSKTDQAEILLNPQKNELLVQGAKDHTDLMLGYLANDEIFLDSHSISEGFVIQKSPSDIERAKALLLGKEKTELVLSTPLKNEEEIQALKSSALLFEELQVSYPKNLFLGDKSTLQILLPPGPAFTIHVTSQKKRLMFVTPYVHVQKRKAPSMLTIPFHAQGFGQEHIILQTEETRKELPVTIRASLTQQPTIHVGTLKVQQGTGAQLTIPAGHYSLGTDTHAEHRLLEYVFPYLYKVPNLKNRMERIQVVSQSWDALFHSKESLGLSLLEQAKIDVEYGLNNWQNFHNEELLEWLHTIVVMNQSALYVPTEHVLDVYSKIKDTNYPSEKRAFLYFILARAQQTPLKGLLSLPPKATIKELFSTLSNGDRIWLIPALEKDNRTRHWTYSNYAELQQKHPARIMMAFFRIREYRYRIRSLRTRTPFNTHHGILAQLQHARDRRLNRYSIHAFLWDQRKIIERGGHRRRAHHPLIRQETISKPTKLNITAKGEGVLRYTLSTRDLSIQPKAKGLLVQQSIKEHGEQNFLEIQFDVPEKGEIWISDQVPSGVHISIVESEWISEASFHNQELLIKTKELLPGRYHIRIPARKKYKGTYQDPPVRIGFNNKWFAQSSSSTITIE